MPQTYVTEPGDTLWALAERYYGDGNLWTAIYEANRPLLGDNPNSLFAGKTLIIPDVFPGNRPPSGVRTYVTTDTDTLWDIAQRFYGNGDGWPAIYEANKTAIGNDPNVLRGGLSLIIP